MSFQDSIEASLNNLSLPCAVQELFQLTLGGMSELLLVFLSVKNSCGNASEKGQIEISMPKCLLIKITSHKSNLENIINILICKYFVTI